jgi:hypothetical protein
MNVDIGRSVTYPFEDQEWFPKVGILLILGFIPGLNVIAWGGYALSIARNVMRGEPLPLPEWADWSDIAVRGLLSIAATFIYYLPVILLSCCLWGAGFFLGGRNSSLLIAGQCCFGLLALAYSLGTSLLLNVGYVRFVQSDQFHSYLDFGRRFQDLRTEPGLFITLTIYQILLSLIAVAVGTILSITCIGPVVIGALAFMANGYILGSAAAVASRRLRQSGL